MSFSTQRTETTLDPYIKPVTGFSNMPKMIVIFFLQLLLSFKIIVTCLRDNPDFPLVVDYDEYYYYHHLKDKMQESLSVNNCTIAGAGLGLRFGEDADISVRIVTPDKSIIAKWGKNSEKKKNTRIFTKVSDYLCSSSRFRDLKRGIFKRAKGCYEVYEIDSVGRKIKRINTYGATLHPEHVRCDLTDSVKVCNAAISVGIKVVPHQYRELNSYPFIVTANNALVSRSGMFALPCGPFGLFSSCEAVNWGLMTASLVVPNITLCRSVSSNALVDAPLPGCPFPIYEKVFIMTQYDDTQIGQFMQEALPKLVYHLDFLLANPDVKIHYGFTKQPKPPNFVLPHYFIGWLGLLDRLINGTVYAKQIFMPREGGCQDIGYNAWEIVNMRERFLSMANINEDTNFVSNSIINDTSPYASLNPSEKPSLLLLTRSPGKFTQNKADYRMRGWPKESYPYFLNLLNEQFPHHNLEIFSDANDTLMTCPLCQAAMFHRSNIVIGIHGAGLSNAIYMKPGGVVVEVILDFDSRHAPIVGIFPRVSSIIGLHHYTYYVDKLLGVNVTRLVQDTLKFVRKVNLLA